jgi:hypothetical protein
MRARHAGSEMITEIYVPRARLASFLDQTREDFRRHRVELIDGTMRLIERDDDSFLAWAREPWPASSSTCTSRTPRTACAKLRPISVG